MAAVVVVAVDRVVEVGVEIGPVPAMKLQKCPHSSALEDPLWMMSICEVGQSLFAPSPALAAERVSFGWRMPKVR